MGTGVGSGVIVGTCVGMLLVGRCVGPGVVGSCVGFDVGTGVGCIDGAGVGMTLIVGNDVGSFVMR